MKILKIIMLSLGVAATSLVYISCNKGNPEMISSVQDDFNNKALVQVFIATVNASRNYVYVDAKPVAGAPLVSGSLFPASGTGFAVDGGVRAFLIRDTAGNATQVPLSFAENLTVNTHQTIFVYDTISSPKQKTVIDNIVFPVDTAARLRFANFIYNPNAIPGVDVFSFKTQTNIFTNVNVTDVTNFIPYPSRAPLDTLYIRQTGTMNQLLKVAIGTLTPRRHYTFVYRGSDRGTRTATLYGTY